MIYRHAPLIAVLCLLAVHVRAEKPQSEVFVQEVLQAVQDPHSDRVLIAAHRGGYANDRQDNAPENSVANIDVAIRKGFEFYETDIRRTLDGVFVLVHDSTLDRETDGKGPVERRTLQEVKQLKKRFRDGSVSDHEVATLEEFLVAGKDRLFLKADLKPGVIEYFDQLARLLHRYGMAKRVILRTTWKDADRIEEYFGNGTPSVQVMFKVRSSKQVQQVADRFHPQTIHIDIAKGEKLSSEKLFAIKRARELGMLVQTHVYNDPGQWEELFAAGVRMFHTADPDRVRKRFANK